MVWLNHASRERNGSSKSTENVPVRWKPVHSIILSCTACPCRRSGYCSACIHLFCEKSRKPGGRFSICRATPAGRQLKKSSTDRVPSPNRIAVSLNHSLFGSARSQRTRQTATSVAQVRPGQVIIECLVDIGDGTRGSWRFLFWFESVWQFLSQLDRSWQLCLYLVAVCTRVHRYVRAQYLRYMCMYYSVCIMSLFAL